MILFKSNDFKCLAWWLDIAFSNLICFKSPTFLTLVGIFKWYKFVYILEKPSLLTSSSYKSLFLILNTVCLLGGICPSSTWGDVIKGVDLINQVGSFEVGSIAASLGTDLQTVAESIAQAASVGVTTDLEAAAAGLGYGSFSDAVAAYNAQYGTNYTAEEAAAALGN